MDDFSEPNYRVTTQTTPAIGAVCPESGGTSWLWIVLFLLALAGIIALSIWIAFLYHNRSKEKGTTIDFKGAKIELAGDTSLKGSWDDTGDSNDIVTLYATTNPPQFNTDGSLKNPEPNQPVQKAASGATSVVLTQLQPRLKYYASLVATNNSASNYQVYTQLVYMSSSTPAKVAANPTTNNLVNNTFSIQDMLQVGKLEAPEVAAGMTGPIDVLFNQAPAESRSLWYINNNGQIQLDEVGTGADNLCLFKNANNGLVVQDCGATGSIDLTNSSWTYKNNKWCLQTTANTDSPACMVLGDISSSSQKAPVTVVTTSTVGDTWVNAFENP